MPQLTKIAPEHQEAALGTYWQMLKELESKADVDGEPVLKHIVAGFFAQWNTMTDSDAKPAWVLRAENKSR